MCVCGLLLTQTSSRGQKAIKCSIKTSEGFLYLLEKAFMFVPKPATYYSYDNTQLITFSRVHGAVSALSTFDITVVYTTGGLTQFSNISREDLPTLEAFLKDRKLRVKNEIDEDAKLLAAALRDTAMDEDDDDDSDAGGRRKGTGTAGVDRGSADEDDESPDEDFEADSESDVAEEFDSDHESSGSGSDESGVDDDGGGDGDEEDDDAMDVDEAAQKPAKKKK